MLGLKGITFAVLLVAAVDYGSAFGVAHIYGNAFNALAAPVVSALGGRP